MLEKFTIDRDAAHKTDAEPLNKALCPSRPSSEQLLQEIGRHWREVDTRLDMLGGAINRETSARVADAEARIKEAEAEWLKAEKRAEEAEARAEAAEKRASSLEYLLRGAESRAERAEAEVERLTAKKAADTCDCPELNRALRRIAAYQRYEEEAEDQIAKLERKIRDLKAQLANPAPAQHPESRRLEVTIALDFKDDNSEDNED